MHGTQKTAGNNFPMTIFAFLIAQIIDIGIFETSPLDPSTIVLGNTIGRKISNFYIDSVRTGTKITLHHRIERHRPKGIYRRTIHRNTGTLPHITEIENPLIARYIGQIKRDGIGCRTSIDRSFGYRKRCPRTERIDRKCTRYGRFTFGKNQ